MPEIEAKCRLTDSELQTIWNIVRGDRNDASSAFTEYRHHLQSLVERAFQMGVEYGRQTAAIDG